MLYGARLSISSKFIRNLIDKTLATLKHSIFSLGSDTNLLKQQWALHLSPQLTDYFRITELLILPDYQFGLRNIGDFFSRCNFTSEQPTSIFYSILFTLRYIFSQALYLSKSEYYE